MRLFMFQYDYQYDLYLIQDLNWIVNSKGMHKFILCIIFMISCYVSGIVILIRF